MGFDEIVMILDVAVNDFRASLGVSLISHETMLNAVAHILFGASDARSVIPDINFLKIVREKVTGETVGINLRGVIEHGAVKPQIECGISLDVISLDNAADVVVEGFERNHLPLRVIVKADTLAVLRKLVSVVSGIHKVGVVERLRHDKRATGGNDTSLGVKHAEAEIVDKGIVCEFALLQTLALRCRLSVDNHDIHCIPLSVGDLVMPYCIN